MSGLTCVKLTEYLTNRFIRECWFPTALGSMIRGLQLSALKEPFGSTSRRPQLTRSLKALFHPLEKKEKTFFF